MNWMERLNERAEMMGRMLKTISAAKKPHASRQAESELRSAALLCLNCKETEACRDWRNGHRGGAAIAVKTCPNSHAFYRWPNRWPSRTD